MMQPFSFNLQGRKILFIGGGKVAERKLKAIINEGCEITVVGPAVTEYIAQSGVAIVSRSFEKADITEDLFMVFCCTDNRKTNAEAAELAKFKGILVNIADDPEASDFHTTSVIRQGDFVISISTEGKDPSKTKELRQNLQNFIKNI
jgi:precorrin-2 dehydrogenase/sirohydrochlorin ferrochelatase